MFGSKPAKTYGSIVISVFIVVVCTKQKRNIFEFITIIMSVLAFSWSIIGFSLWNVKTAKLEISEEYAGKARIVSPNASNEGYKNIVLELDNGEKTILLTDQIYEYDDDLYLEGLLTPIRTHGNPGDFDYRSYYRRCGIVRMIDAANIVQLEETSLTPVKLGYRVGSTISKAGYQAWLSFTDEETAMFLSAIITGNDSRLTKETQETFRRSNLAHLLVVSGAHVGYFASTVGFLAAGVFEDRRKRSYFLYVCLIGFGFITGWSGSATRSILTYVLVNILSFTDVCVDRVSACACSALTILFFDPFSMFSQGMLLSFGATFSIMLFHHKLEIILEEKISFIPEEIRTAISCFICARIGMIPVLVSMGDSISLPGMFVVVLAGFPAEVICSIVPFLTIFCCCFPGTAVGRILFYPLRGEVLLLEKMAVLGAKQSTFRFSMSRMPLVSVVLGACFVIIPIVRPGVFRFFLRYIALLSAISFILQTFIFTRKVTSVYFLDVGQGDCAMICHNGMNILIDGGKKGSGEKILSVLEYLGIHQIDVAFMSHLDVDHVGGIIELYQMGRIGILYAPFWEDSPEMVQLEEQYSDLPQEVTVLRYGDSIRIDESFDITVLWPFAPQDGGNSDSLVLLLNIYKTSVLFTGDIPSEIEQRMQFQAINTINVLKIAHHGSRYSTSCAFLQNKNIGAAVISVGYNLYGHPSPDVLNRLSDHRIPYFRTDEGGCVLLSVEESGWNIDYFFES